MQKIATDSFNSQEYSLKINKNQISIGATCRLTLTDAKLLSQKRLPVVLNPESTFGIENSYQFLNTCINNRMAIYGVNTHFGDQVNFLDPYIKDKAVKQDDYHESINNRQKNLIKSHSCGVGNIISADIVRIAMMLRAHCLAQGFSGVSLGTVQGILNFLNSDIVPVVRCYGSIGASGDLIPLSMIAAGITGENVPVFYRNEIMQAPEAIKLAGLTQIKLKCRDGLAMINGTSFMTAIASLSLYNLRRLFPQMLYAIAMALESMLVIGSSYHPLVHQLKHQLGEINVNNFMLNFWEGTQLLSDLDSLRSNIVTHESVEIVERERSVQDYYSLRAVSQGFGPFQENIEKATLWVENEMNAISDNPIIDFNKEKIYHSANFMGYYVTSACDILKMDIAQASTWLHALLANLVHPRKNQNMPANLVENPGIHNGFRPIQLLAAALAVQNRKLAQSQQSFMLPTEGDNQDVNSLGTHAALDLQESVNNLERLTAIILLAATQALEIRGIEKASHKARNIHEIIRQHSKKLVECRPMTIELEAITNLLAEEKI